MAAPNATTFSPQAAHLRPSFRHGFISRSRSRMKASKRPPTERRGRRGIGLVVRAHKVTLKLPEKVEKVIECDEDTFILDAADVIYPLQSQTDIQTVVYRKPGWNCPIHVAREPVRPVPSGEVDNEEQSFLDDGQLEQGFILTCTATPMSDCVVETHQEESLY